MKELPTAPQISSHYYESRSYQPVVQSNFSPLRNHYLSPPNPYSTPPSSNVITPSLNPIPSLPYPTPPIHPSHYFNIHSPSFLPPLSRLLPPEPHLPPSPTLDDQPKVFSFIPLPGLNQNKRPRRKYNEVERLYQCNHPYCTKAYGTLNHLNAHVAMQNHGPKRQPAEFKELRKIWRRQKREKKQRLLIHQSEDMSVLYLPNQPNPLDFIPQLI